MAKQAEQETQVIVEQRRGERRRRSDRRAEPDSESPARKAGHVGTERRKTTRRKVERRRQIDPTTCERDYSDEEIEFMRAMDEYKRRSGRQFPTWSEVLEVLYAMGYRKVAEPKKVTF